MFISYSQINYMNFFNHKMKESLIVASAKVHANGAHTSSRLKNSIFQ